jgi:hypothetical protein
MLRLKFLITALNCIMIAGISSCDSLENTGYLHQTATAAHNHIMLVEENPPTFGYERLYALSQHYHDLSKFIEKEGKPKYYAETTNGGSRYLILYYSERREAFACRSSLKSSHEIEFSGPYPITKNELATLHKLERGLEQDFNPE